MRRRGNLNPNYPECCSFVILMKIPLSAIREQHTSQNPRRLREHALLLLQTHRTHGSKPLFHNICNIFPAPNPWSMQRPLPLYFTNSLGVSSFATSFQDAISNPLYTCTISSSDSGSSRPRLASQIQRLRE